MRENIALAAEALIALDLFYVLVLNMKGAEEGKIGIQMDYRKVQKLLRSKTLKSSQLVGDGGSIISKLQNQKVNQKQNLITCV